MRLVCLVNEPAQIRETLLDKTADSVLFHLMVSHAFELKLELSKIFYTDGNAWSPF